MPLIIPVFIPHEGCPHRCLFCNQHAVSGQSAPLVTGDDVAAIIRMWLARVRPHNRAGAEVAFYGGSFTGLAAERQRELLTAVRPFLDNDTVRAIRLSTRPDLIDSGRLDLLVRYGVTTIELGVQSCDDPVLRMSNRGHTTADSLAAARLVRERGLRLGVQLLLGLPGEGNRSRCQTLDAVIGLRPDCVRLYPVLVLKGSGLEQLYRAGGYRPLSLGRAVVVVAAMKKRFDEVGIEVVRMGLQPSAELERALVAGPSHPAFGELVLSRLMLRQTRRLLAEVAASAGPVTLVIAERDQSVFRGLGSANLKRLHQLGLRDRFRLRTDPDQSRQTVVIGG